MEEKKEPHESKFEADFIVDICTEEVRDNFIKDFEEKAGTNLNIYLKVKNRERRK